MGSVEIADIFFKFILPLLSAAVSYGAIKSDIKHMHARVEKDDADTKRELNRIELATLRAHERLDHHVADYHRERT